MTPERIKGLRRTRPVSWSDDAAWTEMLDEIERLKHYQAVLCRLKNRGSDVYFGLLTDGLTLDGTVDITPDEYIALLEVDR